MAVATAETLVEELRRAGEEGTAVRFRGGGTKLRWAANREEPERELSTAGLDRMLEHNAGDLTAVLEAGVPLARAQAAFAEEGQMLALDPPDYGATIGGVVAAGDTGPLRSRYGGVRDLIVGVRLALSDGTVASAGVSMPPTAPARRNNAVRSGFNSRMMAAAGLRIPRTMRRCCG